jgi:hypothetical protein
MAEHYGTAVIPARVRKPKDKPNAEGAVGIISTWIIAALRNQKYFTLAQLNEAIQDKLFDFNNKPFQKKTGCRESVFLEEEKNTLLPLPATSYELAYWKTATVQFNYHISTDKMHYSVPYEYIKHEVDLRITKNIVEVFYNSHRIASHVRLYGRAGQYSTIPEHMPSNHQNYNSWDSNRFISWAKSIGPSTAIVIKAILTSHKIEQQGYRSCIAILKLADKYSVIRVEDACKKALSYTPRPSFKSIQTILQTGQDKVNHEESTNITTNDNSTKFGFSRGASYYGGKNND